MIRYQFFSILLMLSFSAHSQLIESTDLFTKQNYQIFKISPDSSHIASMVELKDKKKIIVFESNSQNAYEVFNVEKGEIYNFDWVDSNSLMVKFSRKGLERPIKVIDFDFLEDDFTINTYEIFSKGFWVDPLPIEDDKILFAKQSRDNGLELYKVNLVGLKSGEYTVEREYFDSSVVLLKGYKNIEEFFLGINSTLNMFKTFEKGSTFYYLKNSYNKWQRFSKPYIKHNKKNTTNNTTDIFKPIAVYGDNKILAISNIGRDKSVVVLFDIKSNQFEDVLYESPYYDIVDASYDYLKKKLVSVVFTEKGIRSVKYLEQSGGEDYRFLHSILNKSQIFVTDKSIDNNLQIIFSSDSSDPGQFNLYNRKAKKLRLLEYVNEKIVGKTFVKGEYKKATNSEGSLLEGFLYVPKTKSQVPLIVMPHGGPVGVQDLNEFDPEVQFLVNRGFSVLKVNFRGSSGYGKEFLNSGRGEFGNAIEDDINDMLELTLEDKRIDKSKVCIYGQSYGGYSSLASVIRFPKKYKCAISAFGITDLPLTFSASNVNQLKPFKKEISSVVGDLSTNYDKLVNNSPVYKADKIEVPVLLIGGLYDEVANFEHTNRMYYVLNYFKKDVELITYKSGHGNNYWIQDSHQYLYIVEFLDRIFNIKRSYSEEEKELMSREYFRLGEMFRNDFYLKENKFLAEKYLRKSFEFGNEEASRTLIKLGLYDIFRK